MHTFFHEDKKYLTFSVIFLHITNIQSLGFSSLHDKLCLYSFIFNTQQYLSIALKKLLV